ncbi:MAG TPA: hypothetical protein DDX54_05860 [Rhodospirillaceae bacterium]|jgi:hypothetical protein|nr:hypothetical protein [Alphaproteobacteria bacterium]HBH26909.1 hypothetical protein [Rhodospirillaceae bacterium]
MPIGPTSEGAKALKAIAPMMIVTGLAFLGLGVQGLIVGEQSVLGQIVFYDPMFCGALIFVGLQQVGVGVYWLFWLRVKDDTQDKGPVDRND